MRTVERYILRQLVAVAVLVTLTLTLAIWLTQSLRFIELIVNRGLSLQAYLYLTMLLLPSFLSLMLPIALFTAVLFTYNKLITDSELVVLRAAGLGPGQLARPALALAAVVVACGYLLTLWLLPMSYRDFKDLEFSARSDFSAVMLKEGTFNSVREGVTIYIRQREQDGELLGILMHDSRIRDKVVTIMAERGKLALTDEGPRIILVNGNRQLVDQDTGKLSMLYFDRYSVDFGKVGQSAQQQRWREPRERYINELWAAGENPLDRPYLSRLRGELHTRLTTPILGFAFTLISLAALLSGEFNRRGQSRRVLIAVGLAAVLQTAAIGMSNALVKWQALTPLPYAVLAGTIALCAWWLIRTQPRARGSALMPTQ
jgi:lipopolysaccharide export system permease protein